MNDKMKWKETLEKYFPDKINNALSTIDEVTADKVEEIRLRSNQPLIIYTCEKAYRLPFYEPLTITVADIADVFSAATGKSHYAYKEEISQGFYTLESGIRLGLSGSVLTSNGNINSFLNISGINIRIPRQKKRIALKLLTYILVKNKVCNTLIISAPKLGKTTLARDIARCAGSGDGMSACKVSLIDERQELSGIRNGVPQFDIGEQTDVLANVPKYKGAIMALRALSPDVIVTDEIGRSEDLSAIREAANSGVKMIATAHSSSFDSLLKRLFFESVFKEKMFERYVLLSATYGRITVENIYNDEGTSILKTPLKLTCEDTV